MTAEAAPGATQGWRHGPFLQFLILTLLGLALVAAGAVWASERAGHREALNEARSVTEASLRSVLAPLLTAELIDGDPEALAKLDERVRDRLLDESFVRVKVWLSNGTIVYSDATELIGEHYSIQPDRLRAVTEAVAVAESLDLGDPENRFEQELGPLLEVYLPFDGPNGETMLFETYFTTGSVDAASARIRSTVVPIVLISLALVGLLTLLTAARMEARMVRSALEREQLLTRAVDASMLERRRIAADLHDGVIQDLSGTLMLVSAAGNSVNGNRSANGNRDVSMRIEKATAGLRHSLQSLRTLAIEIHPPDLVEVGLEAALNDLADQYNHRYGLDTKVSVEADVGPHQRLVYRFVQEGLRNVVKHANADNVQVSLVSDERSMVASVMDDGGGYEPSVSDQKGMGLKLLRGLAADVEADVAIDAREPKGTSLRLEIPA